MQTRQVITSSLAFLILSASGLAIAAPDDTSKSKDKDLLKGPKIVDTAPADKDSTMDSMKDSSDAMEEKALKAEPLAYREYLVALRQLKADQGGEPLNLSSEQQEQIKSIMKEHRTSMRDFQEANREKMRKLRTASNDGSGAREKRPTDDRPAVETKEDKDLREKNDGNHDKAPQGEAKERATKSRSKLRQFMDNAAPNKQAISKLKQVLSAEQHDVIKASIMKSRKPRMAPRDGADRPDGAQGRRGSDSETAPGNRRRINSDRVNNDGDKGARKGKRPNDAPSKTDD